MLWIATAAALDQVEGAESTAAGSATVATPAVNGAITGNPGIVALDERYTFTGGFGYGERGLHWSFGAVDAKTSPIGLGVVYSGDRYEPALRVEELPGWQVPGQGVTNRKRYHDVAVALGIPMADRRVSIGLGGALSFYDHDRQGKGVSGNLTAGMGFRPDEHVQIGLVGRNLLPVESPGRELELMGGLWVGSLGVAGLSAEGGVQLDGASPLLLAAGGEVWAGEGAAIRGGWRLEDAVHHGTLGFGVGPPLTSLDLALQVPFDTLAKPAGWTFLLSVRFQGPDVDAVQPDE